LIKILGIDPGSINTGYGIIESKGNYNKHIKNGVIKIKAKTLAEKLKIINLEITTIIKTFEPDEIAIEKVFMHRNADSALKLGQARGAAIAACAINDIPLFEYSANQVKKACVGKGHAAKEQVQHMIKILLCLENSPLSDAADALAIALCHANSRESLLRMQGISGMKYGRLQ
jgi:crossover junction endodeoxyribonuclease RuvC|tara:strand:- start:663 stop:1181 length:519 start_codon:yes stop_codon:yes gene_type:complete